MEAMSGRFAYQLPDDGTHSIPQSVLQPENVVLQDVALQREPFAFDLRNEQRQIRRYGESYRDFFRAQAHYYAKETYGKTPRVTYEHDITRDALGNVELTFGPQNESAKKSYAKPKNDTTLPQWYRDRAAGDEKWTLNLETMLETAKPGDKFFDLSPTAFEVPFAERSKWSFGWHSFVRVHEVIVEDGKEKLISKALRNYLDLPEQTALFATLTGDRLSGQQLIGAVGRLNRETEAGHLELLAKKLYDQTPVERKIVIPKNDQVGTSNTDAEAELAHLDSWLEGIFDFMLDGHSEDIIEDNFHGWENAVKSIFKGRVLDKNYFQGLAKSELLSELKRGNNPLAGFMAEEYRPEANGCGAGAGFGKKNKNRILGGMDYEGITSNEQKWGYHKGDCVNCKQENTEVGPCSICKPCEEELSRQEEILEFFPSSVVFLATAADDFESLAA